MRWPKQEQRNHVCLGVTRLDGCAYNHGGENEQERKGQMMKCTSIESLLLVHKLTREELLTIVDQSSFIVESKTSFLSWWNVYVFKVDEEKGKNVWPN
jgi:hypothetical protein